MKDAKGHGSEARGGSMGRSEFASQPHQGAKFQARQSMKAANSPDSWEARYGTKMDRDRLRADAINQGVNVGFKSSLKDAGLTDKAAAASLAGGHPKSAPVETHPAMATWDVMSHDNQGRLVNEGTRTGPRPERAGGPRQLNPNWGGVSKDDKAWARDAKP